MTTARGRTTRTAAGFAVAALVALSATACGGDDTPSSLASRASGVAASATAAAASKMASVKDGVNGKGDVKAGATKTDGNRSVADITVTNSTGKSADYAVTVNFKDNGGKLVDVSVVTVKDVAAGGSKTATARSNRDLGGDATAEVGQALRH
jgi:hypothetical protein